MKTRSVEPGARIGVLDLGRARFGKLLAATGSGRGGRPNKSVQVRAPAIPAIFG